MRESVTEQCRVRDEGFRVVNLCQKGKTVMVPSEEATANYVPAAAVIRRVLTLFGIIGRKARVGCQIS